MPNIQRGGDGMVRLPDKELFRADEIKELLQLKRVETVYGWIRKGKIRYVLTPGNQKRIPRSEIERITREMQVNPKPS
jgi:excisionase family DNA binding protein